MDVDAAVHRVDQCRLELLPELVALPDVGLEENLLFRLGDRGEHPVVQVLAEGVRRHAAFAHLHLVRWGDREGLGFLAPTPIGVDKGQSDGDRELRPDQPQYHTA